MKIAVLTPGGGNTEPLYSWLGDRATVIEYNSQHGAAAEVFAVKPDAVLYIGACPDLYDPTKVPVIEELKMINRITRSVHLCCDGGEPKWWNWINEYRRCFAAQVNIDGVHGGPWYWGEVGLFPVDPALFDPLPWADRPIAAGFGAGLYNQDRWDLVATLGPLVTFRPRDAAPYKEYADFTRMCKVVVNHARNGLDALQVKARVLEAGAAGCLVLEQAGSPLRNWFNPGEHYLEYRDAAHAADILRNIPGPNAAAIGARLREAVLAEYTAEKFFRKWGLA